ncbi:hypothetical protein [Halomonas sp. GT]|uniref:hypothetical protein n=1 Tax=Halomonas sp. GT TaxID=1971364 RepID=UPI0009F462C4|nr:hypothetical protein [Halomonas sp. GT]
MVATRSHPPTDANNATFRIIDGPHLNRPSPELARVFLHREATGNGARLLVSIKDLYIPEWDKKPLSEKDGKLSFSRGLRSFHQVLEQVRRSASDCRLAAVTVTLSEKSARQMVASSKKNERSFINTHANRINKRLRDRGIPAAWFGVVEDCGDRGRAKLSGLHVHMTVAYHVEDEVEIKAVFRKDKRDGNNSFMTWKVEHEGRPISISWSDYQSKDLFKRSDYLSKGSERIFAPKDIRAEAKQLYETRRKRLTNLEKHWEELESRSFTQIWGFIQHGRSLPSREPEPFDWEYHDALGAASDDPMPNHSEDSIDSLLDSLDDIEPCPVPASEPLMAKIDMSELDSLPDLDEMQDAIAGADNDQQVVPKKKAKVLEKIAPFLCIAETTPGDI